MVKELIACPQCDALVHKPSINEGQKVLCLRCGGKIFDRKVNSINRTLALALAGLLCFIPAVFIPMIGIGAIGIKNEASLFECVFLLIDKQFYLIACCIFTFTIAVPLVQLLIAFHLAFSIKRNTLKKYCILLFRSYHVLNTWAMLHVFFLGLVVAMYKLLSLAELTLSVGLFAYVGFLILSIFTSLMLDRDLVWKNLERLNEH